MSKADEMFKELGFIKIKDDICWCEYIKENKIKLSFEKNIKKLFIEIIENIPEEDLEHKDLEKIIIVNVDFLLAINEKSKELGFFELINPIEEIKKVVCSFKKIPRKIKMKEKYYKDVFIKNVEKVSLSKIPPFAKYGMLPLEIDNEIENDFEVVYE